MAVKIRLRRMGQKKAPFYRIIVADSRSPRDGRCIEEIGTYDPSTDPSEYQVDAELAKKWLSTALSQQRGYRIFSRFRNREIILNIYSSEVDYEGTSRSSCKGTR